MNDKDMKHLLDDPMPIPVTVKASDYCYDGWAVFGGEKRSGAFRVVIEDDYGRLFIHNSLEVRKR
jgi:hypothetical protein